MLFHAYRLPCVWFRCLHYLKDHADFFAEHRFSAVLIQDRIDMFFSFSVIFLQGMDYRYAILVSGAAKISERISMAYLMQPQLNHRNETCIFSNKISADVLR